MDNFQNKIQFYFLKKRYIIITITIAIVVLLFWFNDFYYNLKTGGSTEKVSIIINELNDVKVYQAVSYKNKLN